MPDRDDWRPVCSPEVLRIRAAMLKRIREFFASRSYLEVETPCLSRDVVLDAWLDPFCVPGSSGEHSAYLQTSPEAFMKRLLAAGSGSIFQVAKVFRRGELGERHNPEFTMVEWYGVGDGWEEQAALTEELVRTCVDVAAGLPGGVKLDWPAGAFGRLTYAEAFERAFGVDVHRSVERELRLAAEGAGVVFPETGLPLDRDDLLNLMLGFVVEPCLGGVDGAERPEFLCDYPPTQAALAVVAETDPPVARRFELYVRGLEICNGYEELTDAEELGRRERLQSGRRREAMQSALPGAPRLSAALAAGLPPCSGVALGFDRLVMLAVGAKTIREVLAFPGDRA